MPVGSTVLVNKWKRARSKVLRKVAKDIKFFVHLQRDVMDMYLGLRNVDRYALEHSVEVVREHLGHFLRSGIHRRGSVAQVPSIKGGPITE